MCIERDKSLKELNTFGIDVCAKLFAEYHSVQELQQITAQYRSGDFGNVCADRMLHIGAGSNLLFLSDYEGLVLHSAIRDVEVVEDNKDDVVLRVGSGIVFDDLVDMTLHNGWFGLENLSLIPGEVGACAVQNIGAYGVEAKDFITEMELVDLHTGTIRMLSNREAEYSYRYSILKSKELWGRYAVTHVYYRLSKTFTPKLSYGGLSKAFEVVCREENSTRTDKEEALLLRQVIIDMRQGKLPDPKVLGNAGSFFMNPIIPRSQFEDLLMLYPDMPHYDVDEQSVKVPAGWLIDQSGWKGKRLGNAGVYEKQALVLVNLGGANGSDIVALSKAVQKDVKQKFGIEIHPEVNFI